MLEAFTANICREKNNLSYCENITWNTTKILLRRDGPKPTFYMCTSWILKSNDIRNTGKFRVTNFLDTEWSHLFPLTGWIILFLYVAGSFCAPYFLILLLLPNRFPLISFASSCTVSVYSFHTSSVTFAYFLLLLLRFPLLLLLSMFFLLPPPLLMSSSSCTSGYTLKMAVFWVVAPCSLVEVYQRFRGTCCLHHQGTHRPDDGGSKALKSTKFM
jgi:hypothetical protein